MAQQRKAQAEIVGQACPVLNTMMGDYLTMRDQVRAIDK